MQADQLSQSCTVILCSRVEKEQPAKKSDHLIHEFKRIKENDEQKSEVRLPDRKEERERNEDEGRRDKNRIVVVAVQMTGRCCQRLSRRSFRLVPHVSIHNPFLLLIFFSLCLFLRKHASPFSKQVPAALNYCLQAGRDFL